jgi:SAM-dependent methyltransferase
MGAQSIGFYIGQEISRMDRSISSLSKTFRAPTRRVTPYSAFASLYDLLIGDSFFPKLRRAFERIMAAHKIEFDSAADVACGTGTFTRYLCGRGAGPVFGVDLSPAMLWAARTKNRALPVRFLRQDMRRLTLPEPVDLITCNFDSLNYLLDLPSLELAFRRFGRNLKGRGCIFFDMILPRPAGRGADPFVEKLRIGDVYFHRSIHQHRPSGLQRSRITISSPAAVKSETHIQRVYPVQSILEVLERSKFHPLGVYDFFHLGPVNPSSQRMIVLAARQEGR